MTKSIAIVSGKGGVGKTVSSINLATALSSFGRDVTVVDAGFQTPNVCLYLGAPCLPVTLTDVFQGKKSIQEATYTHPSGLKLVPLDISMESIKKHDPSKLKDIINDLRSTSEIILIDGGAGLGFDVISTIKAADQVLIVTNPEMPAVNDALKTIHLSKSLGQTNHGIILNRVRGDNFEMPINNVQAILEEPIVAVIPEDDFIRKSLLMKHPLVYSNPDAPAAISYKKLAAKLIGESYDYDLDKEEKKDMFYFIKRNLGITKK